MNLKVLVLDMQPVYPPVGGGRIRLLGLYHNLGKTLPVKYVGSYDWPGEKYRDQYLSETLREILVPLSNLHFVKSDQLNMKIPGKNIIDCSFHLLAHNSTALVKKVRSETIKADIIIFSHPWVYPLVMDVIDKSTQLVVYDAHNVEGFLRTQLLDDGGSGTKIAEEVVKIEYQLCNESDLIISCSHEDRLLFNKLYEVPISKVRIIPNGVFADKILPPSKKEKKAAKRKLELSKKKTALFIGSFYEPNLDAANFICFELAPKLPEINFVICGGVCKGISKDKLESAGVSNVTITGFVTEKDKYFYLKAADVAVNPVNSGSGTNIKMFDFFAAGLPVITTPTGGRGIEPNCGNIYIESDLSKFAFLLKKLIGDPLLQESLSQNSRNFVKEKFAWERISPALGILLERRYNRKNKKPCFSVIIPSYERHKKLTSLMKFLSKQSFKNFEVIIVDQSKKPWEEQNNDFSIDILYLHTDIKGAVKARNTGAAYAMGTVITFTDDDCEPDVDWLYNAYRHFNENKIVGIEGLIKSGNTKHPDYRAVSNKGVEGIGFMTANLHIISEVFYKINGFDEMFDLPHFREDTDLGWRALKYGDIPYAENVIVYHPPHPRNIKRESRDERDMFFTKDALLLKKHPQKYKQLFYIEKHYTNSAFRKYFYQGTLDYKVTIPDWCLECFRNIEMQQGNRF